MDRRSTITITLAALLRLAPAAARAGTKGKIIKQELSSAGEGYTILSVWGSHYDMGYAQGTLMHKSILLGAKEIKTVLGSLYPTARTAVQGTVWKPAEVEKEMDGIMAGIKAKDPSTTYDKVDLKLAATYSDWSYIACRAHSAWGSYVKAPVKTLSTRRLDYNVPSSLTSVKHHVLIARAPTGGVRWVSLAWPGIVSAVTGVNEFGTQASLHDYNSSFALGAHMPRSVAVRWSLTMVKGLPVKDHLSFVHKAFQAQSVSTTTFINYYVPEGQGGVFTFAKGKTCDKLRTPQKEYFNGEVITTTNTETDGKSTQSDDKFMAGYYKAGGTKTLESHYKLMGHTGMHLLSVAYRGKGDMTLWAEGRLSLGVTPTIKMEWSSLFQAAPKPDAGVPAKDGGGTTDPGDEDDGCSVGVSTGPAPWAAAVLLLGLFVALRVRRSRRL